MSETKIADISNGETCRQQHEKQLGTNGDNTLLDPRDDALLDPLLKTAGDPLPSKRSSGRRTLALFVANVGAVIMFYIFMNMYGSGVIRTLERRFGLRSAQTGLLQSANDIVHVCIVVFIGYFGRTAHKPRIICVTVMFTALAGFMMASPHFLLTPPSSAPQGSPNNQSGVHSSSSGSPDKQFCPSSGTNGSESACDGGFNSTGAAGSGGGSSLFSGAHPAYYIFLCAQFISGVGGSGIHTLSLAFIDENAPENKSSFYIGIITSMYAFGPLGGMLLAAVTLRLPENLLSPVEGTPSDPSWIGCWWLGYLICATGLLASCIPLWFFPKSCKETKAIAGKSETKQPEDSHSTNEHFGKWAKQEIMEFPRRLLSLLRNKAFVVNLCGIVSGVYIIMGVYVNLVRYIEIHFLERAFVGSLIAGLISALAGAIGGFLGGLLMSRLKLRPTGAMKIVLFATVCFSVGLVVILFLGCPQLHMAGQMDPTENKFTVVTECNQHCACLDSRKAYFPVCGSDNLTYFSACMAGCKNFTNGVYSGCSCVGASGSTMDPAPVNGGVGGGGSSDGLARPGLCRPPCQLLIPFAVTLFLMSLIGSTSRVPLTMVNFRIVGDDERAFALSLNSLAVNLFGFVPSPLLFGSLIDSTCMLWQTTCKKTGSCLLYDTDRFRYVTYGVALIFQAIDFVLAVVLFLLVRRMKFPAPETATAEVVEAKSSEKELEKESMAVIVRETNL